MLAAKVKMGKSIHIRAALMPKTQIKMIREDSLTKVIQN